MAQSRVGQANLSVLASPTSANARVGQADIAVFASPTSANARVAQVSIAVFTTFIAPVHDISGYLRDKLINHIFRTSNLDKPSTVYLALFLLPPHADGTGGTEVSGGSYARASYVPYDGNWSAPSAGNGITHNLVDIVFPTPSADWGNVSAWGLYDAAVGGNLLFYSTMTSLVTVLSGSNPRFVTNDLTVTLA